MSRYASVGTLRYHLSKQGDERPATKIIFVPSEEYSIKHHGKTYAIFVSAREALLRKYEPESKRGITLNVADSLADHLYLSALQAATGRARVEIVVMETEPGCADTPDLELVSITVPAE